jgi:hypothetical protein
MNESMNKIFQQAEDQPVSLVLRETWHTAESITEKGIYQKMKYREVERIGFYIRPLREWFWPSQEDQKRLKKMLAEGSWILGNDDYKPAIELNTTTDELDDESWVTLEEHKATPEEIKRIGLEGWERLT